MNILVIKQTSLGDVLHSTGHVRTLRENFPAANITLLTASTSQDIYRHNPFVDDIIVFDRYAVKRNWLKKPGWTLAHILEVVRLVRLREYDYVFDLQGRWKSVMFLYASRTTEKSRRFVKGRWWFARRFHQPELHAMAEMNGVLRLANIDIKNNAMEFATGRQQVDTVRALLDEINPARRRILILSPFTRRAAKNWPLENYKTVVDALTDDWLPVFTGAGEDTEKVTHLLANSTNIHTVNLCGKLSLLEFAELVRRVDCVVTGDSFPMHVATAQNTPLIALFGPTEESRVGPTGDKAKILRAKNCTLCVRRKRCRKNCIASITPQQVLQAIVEAAGHI